MSESRPMISAENQQTVLAVCFVLTLLTSAFGLYNYSRTSKVISATAHMNNINVENIHGNLKTQGTEITALEAKVTALEGKLTAMTAAAAAAPPATAAPAGK